MRFFAGIDGGQSSTRAVVGDERGKILGVGTAGPADEVHQQSGSTRLADALSGALSAALHNASLPDDTPFAQIVAGVSGYEGTVYGQAPQLHGPLTIVHDTTIAHAGAFGGGAGVLVIAGTGSAALARAQDHREALVGGWGYLFGDEGSAFWIARTALAQAFAAEDRGEAGDFAQTALQRFALPSLRALARSFYTGRIGRDAIAAFTVDVLRTAEMGSGAAEQIMYSAAQALAALAHRAARRVEMQAPHIAFTGGLLANQTMRELAAQRLHALLPAATIVQAKYDAAEGALLLAYRAAAMKVAELQR